jgi:hypothetical protein
MSETTAAFATTALSGYELLADPQFNKGRAFSESEREAFDLHGLLPPNVATLDEQVSRRLQALRGLETDLERYALLRDGFCDCGHADRASPARLAPAASPVTHICSRRTCARNSSWALPSGSKPGATVPLPPIDVRVQWSTRHQDNAAQHAPVRELLLRTLSNLSDALVSAQWGEDWIPPAILDHDRFRQAPMPADR